jgi:hypothetical protein
MTDGGVTYIESSGIGRAEPLYCLFLICTMGSYARDDNHWTLKHRQRYPL